MTDIDKVKDRAAKLKAMMDGAKKIGSEEEADAFAAALNRLLIEHDLGMDDVAYAKRAEEPIIDLVVDQRAHGITFRRKRSPWQEKLAEVVGWANMCRYAVTTGTNHITFIGTKQHAEVAAYLFAVLVRTADALCEAKYRSFYHKQRHTCAICNWPEGDHLGLSGGHAFRPNFAATHGYRESFMYGFVNRLLQRFVEERRQATAENTTTALMRIDQSLARVNAHIKDRPNATKLQKIQNSNRDALAHGIAAADDAVIKANALKRKNEMKKLEGK